MILVLYDTCVQFFKPTTRFVGVATLSNDPFDFLGVKCHLSLGSLDRCLVFTDKVSKGSHSESGTWHPSSSSFCPSRELLQPFTVPFPANVRVEQNEKNLPLDQICQNQ